MVVLWKKLQNPEDTGSVRFHFKSEQNFKVKLILTDRIKAIDKSHTFFKKICFYYFSFIYGVVVSSN